MIPEHLHFKIVSPRISPRAWALALTAALFLLRSLGPLAPAFAQTNPAREGLAESIVAVKLERGVELRLLVDQRLGTPGLYGRHQLRQGFHRFFGACIGLQTQRHHRRHSPCRATRYSSIVARRGGGCKDAQACQPHTSQT